MFYNIVSFNFGNKHTFLSRKNIQNVVGAVNYPTENYVKVGSSFSFGYPRLLEIKTTSGIISVNKNNINLGNILGTNLVDHSYNLVITKSTGTDPSNLYFFNTKTKNSKSSALFNKNIYYTEKLPKNAPTINSFACVNQTMTEGYLFYEDSTEWKFKTISLPNIGTNYPSVDSVSSRRFLNDVYFCYNRKSEDGNNYRAIYKYNISTNTLTTIVTESNVIYIIDPYDNHSFYRKYSSSGINYLQKRNLENNNLIEEIGIINGSMFPGGIFIPFKNAIHFNFSNVYNIYFKQSENSNSVYINEKAFKLFYKTNITYFKTKILTTEGYLLGTNYLLKYNSSNNYTLYKVYN